eukprot:scaffold128035_cov31-Tisochrysis_lutea.AAC.1
MHLSGSLCPAKPTLHVWPPLSMTTRLRCEGSEDDAIPAARAGGGGGESRGGSSLPPFPLGPRLFR